MRKTIDLLKMHNEIKIISTPLDIELEIPHLAYLEVKKKESKALLFTNPICKRLNKTYETPVLMNLFGNFKRVELLIGDTQKIAKEISYFLKMKPPKGVGEFLRFLPKIAQLRFLAPCVQEDIKLAQEVVYKGVNVDLLSLPVIKTWEEDGGAFITMGQCYTQSLNGEVKNLGMYRLQVYDKNHLGLHWQLHKDSVALLKEYKEAKQKMPVSIALGGDPLYTWCATAPLPKGIYELMLYGFIKKKRAKLIKCISNPLCVPYDCDFVIEGFVDPNELKEEGRFGDHTGFYTPIEPYPVMEVSAITSKKNPVFLATVVGKPPLEDKYLGYPTERIFLPLLQTTTPNLIDYYMPENGVFHNLILAKIKSEYEGEAKQSMHAFWGVGQMSFVKHALFVNKDAPSLESAEIITFMLNRFSVKECVISEGICDVLDHSSPNYAYGGKLGVDLTKELKETKKVVLLEDEVLKDKLSKVFSNLCVLKQIYKDTLNPIVLLGVEKQASMQEIFSKKELAELTQHLRIVVVLDAKSNDLDNLYMVLWRVVNNIDAKRDIKIIHEAIFIDATNKSEVDGHLREWPKETDCTRAILDNLREKGLLEDFSDEELEDFYRKFHIDKSYSTKT
ncbi:menaquinone biosynthesis decarboxylase [Helicobacter burdigaliensis]|uniref:menaquinone biosynthesis decarboxylase n=1 Tax=Helicobacter burdigaliensis TaxID=2315334 RepID=UPI000EF67DA1|nr:menaquinone biosynthesis decarboxylase [Helicobacter burdigaliensis]